MKLFALCYTILKDQFNKTKRRRTTTATPEKKMQTSFTILTVLPSSINLLNLHLYRSFSLNGLTLSTSKLFHIIVIKILSQKKNKQTNCNKFVCGLPMHFKIHWKILIFLLNPINLITHSHKLITYVFASAKSNIEI